MKHIVTSRTNGIPFIINDEFSDELLPRLGVDGCIASVGILSRGVVSPNDDILHFTGVDAQSLCKLSQSSVVIEPREAGDVLRWNGRGEFF